MNMTRQHQRSVGAKEGQCGGYSQRLGSLLPMFFPDPVAKRDFLVREVGGGNWGPGAQREIL